MFAAMLCAKEMLQDREVLAKISSDPAADLISLKDITWLARTQRNQFIVQADVQFRWVARDGYNLWYCSCCSSLETLTAGYITRRVVVVVIVVVIVNWTYLFVPFV